MWKPEHRVAADRRGLRYPSDLTDAEWALVAPLIRPAKRGGRPRTVDVREVLNAIFYVLWTGCQWKALPKDLPPRSTVWAYLDLWDWDGTLGRIHHALYVEVREKAGRETSPTTAIIDSQSGKTTEAGGERGFDGAKKSQGAQTAHHRTYDGESVAGDGPQRGLVRSGRRHLAALESTAALRRVPEGLGGYRVSWGPYHSRP